jgi:hypothetical protein
MAKKKSKHNFTKFILVIIAALVLGLGTAALASKLLSESESKAPTKIVTNTTNSNNDKKKIEPEISKDQKLEPEVTNKPKKETAPEQGNVDKKTEVQPEQNKAQQTPPAQQPIKSNEKLIDPFMENYLNIYINLANDSELEFYYLDNVVEKNGKFSKILTEEIQKLRQAKVKYSLDDFKIESITKGGSDSELIVIVSQTINKKITKYTYTVYFDKTGVFIKDRK